MACLHPHTKVVVNPLTGEKRTITYPCGHCINCLHDFQESWRIRLEATSCAYGSIVFDTLTVRPEAMGFNDVYEDTLSQDYDTLSNISDGAWKLLCKYKFQIPYFQKSVVQAWLKNGREAFKRHYGHRPDMKYFICQEYGPKTSRPHFHCIIWGVSYTDYMKFWGDVWRKDFGWTKPAFIICNSKSNHASFSRIARYVSKYVSKGQFESPLVEAGLMEKPYRLISKGIGAELLEAPYLKPFLDKKWTQWIQYGKDNLESVMLATVPYEGNEFQEFLNNNTFTEEQINRLAIFYDNQGYCSKMPRYIIDKITHAHEYNLYTYALSTLLRASALVQYNKGLQEVAATMGIFIPDEYLKRDSSTWGLSPESLFMVTYQYTIAQRRKAQAQAERRYTRLRNTYNRLECATDRAALL